MRAAPRFTAVVTLALLAAPAVSFAQAWQEYSYVDAGFAVQLPAAPEMAQATHMVAGLTVPAVVYTLNQNDTEFSMMVADLSGTRADSRSNAIDAKLAALRESGVVKLDVTAEINGQY